MLAPLKLYSITKVIGEFLPTLQRGQLTGLALWVYGTILAQSSCQTAVACALSCSRSISTLRQRLREWLYDGADKVAPCKSQVDVEGCFGPSCIGF